MAAFPFIEKSFGFLINESMSGADFDAQPAPDTFITINNNHD
jgi:hypothetical protein